MSTSSTALRDSATMLRRNLLHARRYPSVTVSTIAMPVVFLLLFGFVFGDAMSGGIAGGGLAGDAMSGRGPAGGGRADYIAYIAPGILVMTAAGGSLSTAVGVCADMTVGIVARFRTMAIWPSAILAGQVVGSMILNLVTIVLVVGATVLTGFRPAAGPVEWLAVLGLLALLALSLTWLSVALGLVTTNVEAASNIVMPVMFLPLLGSGFVPVDSMPAGVRWFAGYQPFTPVIETLRGLLTGTAVGGDGALAVAWCLAIALGGFVWSRALFRRDPVPR